MTSAPPYLARLAALVSYVEGHLDEPLPLERLAEVAKVSPFHLHRLFSSLCGGSLREYVYLARMKWAAHALVFRDARVVEVALGCGYEGPEAFARAFKRATGHSPSDVRRAPRWEDLAAAFEPLRKMRHGTMTEKAPIEVKIVDFPETPVALLEHRGAPARLGETIRAFIAWRKTNGARPPASATFNIVYDDPDATAPEDFRFGLCATTSRPVVPDSAGVTASTIPGGRCAVVRHLGSDDRLGETLRRLYAEWLPTSGEEVRDFPLFFQRVRFFPDVPEAEAITDVFLPLRAGRLA